jgi:hypothetical protein
VVPCGARVRTRDTSFAIASHAVAGTLSHVAKVATSIRAAATRRASSHPMRKLIALLVLAALVTLARTDGVEVMFQ